MIDQQAQWAIHHNKIPRQEINKELVTARVRIKNEKTIIHIAIGKTICSILSMNDESRVHVYAHKNDKNLILIKKSDLSYSGFKLNDSKKPYDKNSRFLTFEFRYPYISDFRLSQTIIVDYEFDDQKILTLDLTKLRWKK